MSVIFENDNCVIIDHYLFINKLYKTVLSNKSLIKYQMKQNLFSIFGSKANLGKETSRKRKQNESFQTETLEIQNKFQNFIKVIPDWIRKNKHTGSKDSSMVRDLAREVFEKTNFRRILASDGNNSYQSVVINYDSENFLIPPYCRFYCGAVDEQCQKLSGSKFDLIIIDPPWWNKYIRRLKKADERLSYSMMYNEEIASLPIKDLMAKDCLVAVWCTNADSNINAVKNLLFPQWGVELITTWYWLKVTVDFEPLCSFGIGSQKQPYERLIIGKVGKVKHLPMDKLVVSVPSALHSHKPPLLDLLTPYMNVENPQTLELFARYLLPNTTSVGYEPLKWQHLSLYDIT